MGKITLPLGLLIFFLTQTLAQVDQTIEPKAFGKDVTEVTLSLIEESTIFPEDYFLLRRIAHVESAFGEHGDTFRPDFHGGIWALSEKNFKLTQDQPILAPLYVKIYENFHIAWSRVSWEDCLKPLHSALASRLFLHLILSENSVPGTVSAQADLWFQNYTVNPADISVQQFIARVKDLESNSQCRAQADLCILLDGSASISLENFQSAKQFVSDFILTFGEFENVRLGFVVFSTEIYTEFQIDNNLTPESMLDIVSNAEHPQGSTYTNKAIRHGVQLFKKASLRPSNIPRAMIVLTDGVSNDPEEPVGSGPIEAFQNNITTLSVGIGKGPNLEELLLISNGNLRNVHTLSSFEALTEFYYKLKSEVCRMPQVAHPETEITGRVMEMETKYYKLPLTEQGVTITIEDTKGQTQVYYAYDVATPNSAFHDGKIQGETYIPSNGAGVSEVFVAVRGEDVENEYVLKFEVGGESVTPTTTNTTEEGTTTTTNTTEEVTTTTTNTTEEGTTSTTVEPNFASKLHVFGFLNFICLACLLRTL